MTFTELQTEIAARLNVASDEALSRIGREINKVYRKITVAINLDLSRRVMGITGSTSMGSPLVTFSNLEKIDRIIDERSGAVIVLPEVSIDQLRNENPTTGDPTKYAIQGWTADTVTIRLDCLAQSVYTLKADGQASVSTLSASDEPAFPESFHDILVEGVLVDEYKKQDKPQLAQLSKIEYEGRLSDLKMWRSKSAYLDIRQGGGKTTSASGGGGGGSAPSGGTSYTQTGLVTFDRDPDPPFAVSVGSAKVANLDADLLDGEGASDFHDASQLIGTIPVPQGGTGQTSVTQGDLLYGSASNVWSKLAKSATATRYLANTGTSNNPAWDQVNLANGVTGDLPFANLTQGSALSVVGVTGNSTADHASIAAASDGDVLRRSGTSVGFGTIATAGIANDAVTYAKLQNVSAASKLLGRGSASGAGDVEEITLGTGLSMSGTTLNGSAANKPFVVFTAAANNPPASAYATPDLRNSHPVLDFDGSTDEEAVFAAVLPTGYASGGLTVDVYVAFTSATSGSVRFQAAIERIDASSLDIDADSFASFQSAGGTAPGTSGQVIKVSIVFTNGSQMDSLAEGEAFRLKVRRDADGTSGTDDITTDAEVLRVVVRET